MRSAWEAFCLLLLAVAAAAQIDTRHLSGQNLQNYLHNKIRNMFFCKNKTYCIVD